MTDREGSPTDGKEHLRAARWFHTAALLISASVAIVSYRPEAEVLSEAQRELEVAEGSSSRLQTFCSEKVVIRFDGTLRAVSRAALRLGVPTSSATFSPSSLDQWSPRCGIGFGRFSDLLAGLDMESPRAIFKAPSGEIRRAAARALAKLHMENAARSPERWATARLTSISIGPEPIDHVPSEAESAAGHVKVAISYGDVDDHETYWEKEEPIIGRWVTVPKSSNREWLTQDPLAALTGFPALSEVFRGKWPGVTRQDAKYTLAERQKAERPDEVVVGDFKLSWAAASLAVPLTLLGLMVLVWIHLHQARHIGCRDITSVPWVTLIDYRPAKIVAVTLFVAPAAATLAIATSHGGSRGIVGIILAASVAATSVLSWLCWSECRQLQAALPLKRSKASPDDPPRKKPDGHRKGRG